MSSSDTSPLQEIEKLHLQAELARENGEAQNSVTLFEQAVSEYQKLQAWKLVSEAYAGMSITYRNLAKTASEKGEENFWREKTDEAIHSSLKYAQDAAKSGDPTGLAMAWFQGGKWHELNEEWSQAVIAYREAQQWMERHPPENNNRPAVHADFALKLALAELFSGKEDALDDVLSATAQLEADTGIDSEFNTQVWVSGAYLKLAQFFASKDKTQAQEFFKKAEAIISANEKLIVRKKELEKLNELMP